MIIPTFYTLDTSHWNQLIEDNDSENYNNAHTFLKELEARNIYLMISLHHLQELMGHAEENKARKRIQFLQNLPQIAWIKGDGDNALIGSVVDVLQMEVVTALSSNKKNSLLVAQEAKSKLLAFGSGQEALRNIIDNWDILRPHAVFTMKRSQEIMSISESNYIDLGETTLSDWMDGELREFEDVNKRLNTMNRLLSVDIKSNGDKRIENSEITSAVFFRSIIHSLPQILDRKSSPAINILKNMGLEISCINPEMTLNELGDLLKFHKRLEIIAKNLNILPFDLKKQISPNIIPSNIIETTLNKYKQKLSRSKGSDLNDAHILCLSPYADVTFVDKRTLENYKRACSKSNVFQNLCGDVRKVSHYLKIFQN